MGRPGAAPPSPSNTNPMDRSTTSEGDYLDPNDGSRPPSRQFVDPEAAAKSRKKWFAIGLCMCLILVLLIAVIVLASTKVTPPPCPPPKPDTNNTASFPGSNDHLKSNEPSLEPSRTEGVADDYDPLEKEHPGLVNEPNGTSKDEPSLRTLIVTDTTQTEANGEKNVKNYSET